MDTGNRLIQTTITNINRGEPYDVYIGRPGDWGNPFPVELGRGRCLYLYAKWLLSQEHLLLRLPELCGKRLGCFCAPLPCHGMILAAGADRGVEAIKRRIESYDMVMEGA